MGSPADSAATDRSNCFKQNNSGPTSFSENCQTLKPKRLREVGLIKCTKFRDGVPGWYHESVGKLVLLATMS
jgi:hypothetical protein